MNRLLWRLRYYALGLLVCCTIPILIFDIPRRIFFKKKPPTGLMRKILGRNPKPPQKDMILVHGVSLGEVKLMETVLPLIEDKLGHTAMLSTSTDTGWKTLSQNCGDRHLCFFPLDLPWAVWHFLRKQKPSMVVLLELELWPLFLAGCFIHRIPVVLFNARVGDRSFKGFKKFKWFWGPIFKKLHSAVAPNQLWADRLKELGVADVHVGASIKGEVVQVASKEECETQRKRLQLNEKPILLLASTSQNEEQAPLQFLKQASWKNDWQIIICPRHPERGPEIKRLCEEHGFSARRSSKNDENNDADILIVDEIGCLGALYALAEIAVVGGSLGSGRHGQNMLESAAAGTCTVVGWDTSNQPDSMALLQEHDAVVICEDQAAIGQHLETLVQDPTERQRLAQAGRQAWETCSGAAERSVQLLADSLKSN